ncbi:Protein transport protein SEC24 like [Verticillium longisporum]|uniref:Protein transport protein SEC24 like n=1 Tax=Verticillium longisporum TaxID=100787 RepID=A0A8I3AI77_VERLO|nr:Protein transport protein SEC24 like [Verticillium longisporum]
MSAPHDGYGQQPYTDEPQQGFEGQSEAPHAQAADHAKKKKRGYASQAYEFGAGANTGVAGQVPAAGAQQYGIPSQPQTPAYAAAGYPGQDPSQLQQQQQQQPGVPQYGAGAPAYGAPQPLAPQPGAPQPAAYGYQAPDVGYPGPGQGAPAPNAPGVAGINQQMAGMNLGPGGQPQPQSAQAARPVALNQLYPTDLLNQPFNVSELDLPPPPIILPPNSSVTPSPHANCSPQYVRSTLNAVPTTHSLLKKSRLPFSLIIQPYGALHDDESPVNIVQDQIIARCRRCRTYINPFVTFLDHGHRWRCNMCQLTNDVPQAFDWDAATQKSTDRWGRHELNYSVVEFVAPQEYMVRPPQPLVYLFLFDVSYASVSTGLLATSARTILDSLNRIPNADRRTRLGFIAVDSSLNYFSIPKDDDENGDTSMLVVSDLDEPFLPVPTDLLVPLTESRQSIENFLTKLPEMFQNNQNNGSALGPALKAGHKLISALGDA